GVSVAGVETVGRPGLASGTEFIPDCAKPCCAKAQNIVSRQIGTNFNHPPCNRISRIHLWNPCETYQRGYVANPNKSAAHRCTRTLRIHTLYLLMLTFFSDARPAPPLELQLGAL